MQIKIFKFNSLRLVYDCCSKNLLPFQFQIFDLNYQSNTKDKHQKLKKKKIRTQLHQGGLSHWKTLSNRKITQTQKLKLKPQIKINQSNIVTDQLTKIETFIRNSQRKTLPNLKIIQTQQL